MPVTRWAGGCLALMWCCFAGQAAHIEAAQARGSWFDIVFDDSCDGMRLRLLSPGLVLGTHTGCNAGELVTGSQFAVDGETGVSVTFFDRTSSLFVRYDIYQTGFRAGRFYVYLVRNNQLLRQGTYSPAPVAD